MINIKDLMERSITSITSEDIPNIDTIGNYAFGYCSSLATVNLPNIVKIEKGAFHQCGSLNNIENAFPNVITIGEDAFSMGEVDEDNYSSITAINFPKAKTLEKNAFNWCQSIETMLLPEVESIGYQCFCSDIGLTTFNLPKIQTIGVEAFRWCSNLTNIELGKSIISIDEYAFGDCEKLTSITIHKPKDSVAGAPWGATNATIIWDDSKELLAKIIDGTIEVITADDLNGLTSIGNYSFSECISLNSIGIPNTVIDIGFAAFYDCTSLTSITIPSSVTSIGDKAFTGCTKLTSITINKASGSITGSPWGAPSTTITWNG